MIDGENVFDQTIENELRTYDNIQKTGQGDDYTIGYLLDYFHLKDRYRRIAIDLTKQ